MDDHQTMLPASFRAGAHASGRRYLAFAEVEARLIEAMETLRRLPDRNPHRLVASDGPWQWVQPEMVAGADDDAVMRTVAATRADVARMEEALGWVSDFVPMGETRTVLSIAVALKARGQVAGLWVDVRATLIRRAAAKDSARGWTTDGLRMRYDRAISAIAKGAARR